MDNVFGNESQAIDARKLIKRDYEDLGDAGQGLDLSTHFGPKMLISLFHSSPSRSPKRFRVSGGNSAAKDVLYLMTVSPSTMQIDVTLHCMAIHLLHHQSGQGATEN